ncbi:polysaccharide lyase family 1 protein [Aspergillus saccharolyticus JOP 1030-1]|uniref:pectin lyase n=1 Tax=Aspergillus saccharolyticus JOP 1030-1 TaxID=1450539 RepID=A0A318ZM08_9EURO|nr:pectin lyase 1 precursor [Aspergillus saccharolyticus JOP 1030-1]PYH48641.1 pectin lyase 1 precursor [Aspergillus saccharolyticus JOP 1030-1]
MKYTTLFAAAAAVLANSVNAGVVGAAQGFAKGVTGGGSAAEVYPKTNDELVSYLGDSQPRVIVLDKIFDFTGTEGTETTSGCSPWGTGSTCQQAINKDNWCNNYEPKAPKVSSITYDKAGVLGITVNSNKSLVGKGSAGGIKGKGIRMVSGAKNIIIQNIAITDINPKYVWGGDAITLNNADLVWIDHVTTARISRQHIVLGTQADNRVTISYNLIDGRSDYSATCNGHHYWGIYLDGSNDMVTLQGNYFYYLSGRMPKVQSNTLLHAVNNLFHNIQGHAFEIGQGGYVLAEGNVFQNVDAPVESPMSGALFSSPDANTNKQCQAYLGRSCQLNAFGSSGTMSGSDTSILSKFKGKNIAAARAPTNIASWTMANAGVGHV